MLKSQKVEYKSEHKRIAHRDKTNLAIARYGDGFHPVMGGCNSSQPWITHTYVVCELTIEDELYPPVMGIQIRLGMRFCAFSWLVDLFYSLRPKKLYILLGTQNFLE